MKLISLALFSALLFCTPLQASPSGHKGNARITRNEAEHIALKRFPGARVTAAKLEKLRGKLVWTVEIAVEKSKPATKVKVDATTGRVVTNGNKKP